VCKYALAGPKISTVIREDVGVTNVWLCKSRKDTHKLQRAIGSAAYRAGLKARCETFVSVREKEGFVPSVYYTVICVLDGK
jgi:hypothetical protein